MGTAVIPIELYKILEDKLGREQATEVVNLYEQTAGVIHTSVKIALKEELKDELVTKAEFKAEMRAIRIEIRFLIILMIIALTLMNPVAAELIKGLLKL